MLELLCHAKADCHFRDDVHTGFGGGAGFNFFGIKKVDVVVVVLFLVARGQALKGRAWSGSESRRARVQTRQSPFHSSGPPTHSPRSARRCARSCSR